MSFSGSIGDIMTDSGISECFGTVYGSTAIIHMLTGKAISRALHGHFTLESALTADLLSQIFPIPITEGIDGRQEIEKDNDDDADAAADDDEEEREVERERSLVNENDADEGEIYKKGMLSEEDVKAI